MTVRRGLRLIQTATIENQRGNRNACTIAQLATLPKRTQPTIPIRQINTAQLKSDFAAAKRGRRGTPLPGSFATGSHMVDRVTLRPQLVSIEAVPLVQSGAGKSVVFSQSSVPMRAPSNPDWQGAPEVFKPPQVKQPPGTVLCSCCGHFVKRKGFSPDKRKKNGLQSWCKTCRSEWRQHVYATTKEAKSKFVM